MDAKKALKGILDTLPFDDNKTKLGTWGAVYGTLGSIAGFPLPTDPTTFIVTSLLTLAIGGLHKWLKKKYPQVEWPKDLE